MAHRIIRRRDGAQMSISRLPSPSSQIRPIFVSSDKRLTHTCSRTMGQCISTMKPLTVSPRANLVCTPFLVPPNPSSAVFACAHGNIQHPSKSASGSHDDSLSPSLLQILIASINSASENLDHTRKLFKEKIPSHISTRAQDHCDHNAP